MKLREFYVEAKLAYNSKSWDNFNNKVNALGGNLRGIGTAVAAASAALLGVTKTASANSREIDLNSQALGINVERLQELEFAAKDVANVSRGELIGSLHGLSSALVEAERSGNVGAFQQLGINLADLRKNGFRADQVMGIVADRFKLIKDPITKASVATEIFGGAGADLIPLLNKGSAGMLLAGKRARDLGLILDKKAVTAGVKFDRQFNRAVLVIQNMAHVIGTRLFPTLEPVIKKFQDFVIKNKDVIATGIVEFAKDLASALGTVFTVAQGMISGFTEMSKVFGGVGNVMKGLVAGFVALKALKLAIVVSQIASAFGGVALAMAPLAFNPLTWVVVAAAGIARIYQKWDDLVKAFKKGKTIIGSVGGVISTFFGANEKASDSITETGDGIGTKFNKSFENNSIFKALASNATPGGIPDTSTNNTNNSNSNINIPITVNTSSSNAGEIATSIEEKMSNFFSGEKRNVVNSSVGGRIR